MPKIRKDTFSTYRMRCAFALAITSISNSEAFHAAIPSGFGKNAMVQNFNDGGRDLSILQKVPPRVCSQLFFHDREADMMEEFVGGMRYEMVELPDSLVDTTIFVGNLCEFVTDEMLSALFQQASTLNFVPACVARKPNSSSLKYGFVTFPTIEEKEAAIIRFSGYPLNNKPLKVEEIIDYKYRVRVPEQLVQYTVGGAKKTRDGTRNTMRMAQNSRETRTRMKKDHRKGKSIMNASPAQDRNRGKKKRGLRKKNRRRNNEDLSNRWC